MSSSSRTQTSGVKLLLMALICAVIPPLAEMLSDGGPSGFGKPETGYLMALTGFFLWPLAFILTLIGLKRHIYEMHETGSDIYEGATAANDIAKKVKMTDAWAEFENKNGDSKQP